MHTTMVANKHNTMITMSKLMNKMTKVNTEMVMNMLAVAMKQQI